jgi:Domain of unknown function (DUF4112)
MISMFNRADRQPDEKQRRAILRQVNTLAWLLDNSIPVPFINYRIGLDALIGLIPGFGDLAGAAISSFIVLQAVRLGVPRATLLRMVANIIIEATFGLVPIVGDFFDATFKANARNVALLRDAVNDTNSGRSKRKNADRGFVALVFGGLIAIVALISAAGVAIFSWLVSLFR